MSRLSDLLRAASQLDPQLAKDLEAEIQPLQKRLRFGLNFERHAPEAVELAGHRTRKGSKVRVLPTRGTAGHGDRRLWRVDTIDGENARISTPDGKDGEVAEVPLDDLILVAEFRDRIYPGLRADGTVERGGDKPFHTVINGENFHVLEQLTFTHSQAVDVIYIDPPYNSGSRDWKYNNDYVEGDDQYRHSKWLAFMERRLRIAKRLLKPDDSVLVVTIDEKEYLRLGLLLEQTFPEARIQMVSSVINPMGSRRADSFSRVDEYIFFVMLGSASVSDSASTMLAASRNNSDAPVRWTPLNRDGSGWERSSRPNLFYPLFVNSTSLRIEDVGEPLLETTNRSEVADRPGCTTVWPMKGAKEARWQVGPETVRELLDEGFVTIGSLDPLRPTATVKYLTSGARQKVTAGDYKVVGLRSDGSKIVHGSATSSERPRTIWNLSSHSARDYGSSLLSGLLPDRKFPFPKSLYAVEDTLRFFVKDKPNAVILDFFAGSGTTAHAVMRLNKQDSGNRLCISVTNNEVSADEQAQLRWEGLRPGDPEWERWGICDYITKPRIAAVITGLTPDGEPLTGDYKFVDEFPMADGFDENAAFFTLTYESPFMVSTDRAFAAIAPMLWLRAGARGARIEHIDGGFAVVDGYGVLRDLDQVAEFFDALRERDEIRIAYIVTDDEGRYQQVASELPHIETVRLYEDYLRNCESTGDF